MFIGDIDVSFNLNRLYTNSLRLPCPWGRNFNPGERMSRLWLSKLLAGQLGSKSRAWKGDDAGYDAKHHWARKYVGTKERCEHCNKKPPDVSRLEMANISGEYLRIASDWLTLCTSCHQLYDCRRKILACPQGHVYTAETTYICPNGWRSCRICRRAQQRNYMERRKQHAAS